jgi:hypothetical protein
MTRYRKLDIYDTILRKERADQLAFWSGFSLLFLSLAAAIIFLLA